MEKRKVVSIYRDRLGLNRGTPLRVSSLIRQIVNGGDFEYFTCSADQSVENAGMHLTLSGNKISDIKAINQFIRLNQIDIVVFHTLGAAYFLLPLKFFNPQKKFVLEMHGFNEEEARLYGDISLFKYYLYKVFYSFLYFFCDAITTCSQTATDILRKYNKNVTTIFGGVDLNKFNPDIQAVESFKEIEHEVVIGYSGNARKWQGVNFLIESFQELNKRDKSFKLVLLLSEKINFNIPEGITVIGPIPHDQVGKYNASFDVLVIPRPQTIVNKISFPSKLMEYLAMGKPVVGSRTSDIHKIIDNGVNGLLYDPGDKEDFIECLLKLKDVEVREMMGKRAYQTVLNGYTWELQGKKMIEVLKSLE